MMKLEGIDVQDTEAGIHRRVQAAGGQAGAAQSRTAVAAPIPLLHTAGTKRRGEVEIAVHAVVTASRRLAARSSPVAQPNRYPALNASPTPIVSITSTARTGQSTRSSPRHAAAPSAPRFTTSEAVGRRCARNHSTAPSRDSRPAIDIVSRSLNKTWSTDGSHDS